MDCKKYIGMDVHLATISIAVMDEAGKVVMDSVIETKARTILEFIQGLRGTLWVTFEEGNVYRRVRRQHHFCVEQPRCTRNLLDAQRPLRRTAALDRSRIHTQPRGR